MGTSQHKNISAIGDHLHPSLLKIMQHTRDALLCLDDTFQIIAANNEAVKLFHHNDLIGKPLQEFASLEPEGLLETVSNTGIWTGGFNLCRAAATQAEATICKMELPDEAYLILRLFPSKMELIGETEERLADILESINETVYSIAIDAEGKRRIVYISPQVENIFGFTADEYQSIDIEQMMAHYHPDDIKSIEEVSDVLKSTKKMTSVMYRFLPKGKDEYIWIEEKIFPKYDDTGRHIANFGLIRDITTRIMSNQRVKDSEERLRILSEAALEGILFSHDGIILDTNDQFARMFGYHAAAELVGKDVYAFLHPDEVPKVKDLIERASEEKFEVRCFRKDGSEFIVESKGRLIPYEGKMVRVSVVIDITESKQYVEELDKRQQSFKNAVDFSPNGILIYVDNELAYANPSVIKLLGYKVETLREKHFADLVEPDYRNRILDRFELLSTINEVMMEEVLIKRKDGKVITIGVQSVNTTYDGSPAVQMILLDLTYQKQLAAEQMRAQIAEEANVHLEEEIQRHQETQIQLRESQQFAQSLIESSIDMIMATNIHDEITEFNAAAKEQFGYTNDDVKGQNPRMLYADEDSFDKVRLALEADGKFSGEIVNQRKDGSNFVSYLAASLLRNEKGEVQGAMGVSRDISELKESQRVIMEQNAKINAIFQSSVHLIWSVDHKKRLTSFNKNFSDTLVDVYNMRPRLGHTIITDESFTTREYNRLWVRKYDQALSGKPQHFETSVMDMKGNERWQDIYLNPIFDEDGNVLEVAGIGQDITYKKEAERQIKDQAAKINSIFESSSQMMMWTLDKHYRITSYNNNFYKNVLRLIGVKTEVGMDFKEMIKPFIREEEYDQLISTIYGAIKGKPKLYEGQFIDKEGKDFWMEAFLNPIHLELGKIREISCLAHDITEKKETERQIKQSLTEKEVLLKEVHHRVKNNLQVISSILNLQSSYVKDENTLNILRESQNRIKSMSFIHESLYQTKNFSSIDFSDYILNLSKNLVHSYRVYNDQVELKLDIDKVFLNLDQAIPCGLIVNELVSNSLKYAFPNGESGEISIGISENDGKVQLRAEDTGIGLPDNFDYRNTDSLGLQLVVTLVEQLDGEIELITDQGKGTKYLITFGQVS